ncbi:methyl-accepting chemotaxis protein [Azospirillum endophyticum]
MPLIRFLGASLMRRALIPLILIMAFIVMAVAFLVAQGSVTEARNTLEEKARLTAGIAALGLQEPLWNLSPDLAEATLRALAEDPDFVSVIVRDDDGKVFAKFGTDAKSELVSAIREITREDRGKVKKIGTVELALSPARSELAATTEALRILIGGVIVLLVVTGFLYAVLRSVIHPISRMTTAMSRLSQGQLETAVPAIDRADEVGAIARAVQVFKDNAVAKLRLENEQAEAAQRTEQEKRRTMHELASGFERAVGSVVSMVLTETTGMEEQAQEMTRAADRTDELANVVASATEQTSINVQTVAAASEQLAGSIDEISRRVTDSSRIVGEAVGLTRQANERVTGLADAVEKIGAVVGLINSIAGQTNLLALNATIEAARAGEAGKGFAVVASEVKALANQTGRATEDIAAQVAAIQSVTASAVDEIKSVAQVIERVDGIATSIASAVEEQGAATKEISRNVQQAASSTQNVATNIAGVTSAAGQSGKTAWAVHETARRLSLQGSLLNDEVTKFLASVRTA